MRTFTREGGLNLITVIDFDKEEDKGTEVIIRHKGALLRVVPDDDMHGDMIVQHMGTTAVHPMPESCKKRCLEELDIFRMMRRY